MKVEDFLDIPKGVSSAKFALSKPKLKNVLMVKFERGAHEIFWKEEYQQENFKSAEFLQKKYQRKNINFNRRSETRGVCTEKRDSIITKLCPHMRENRRQFWETSYVNSNSPDLVKERDPSED